MVALRNLLRRKVRSGLTLLGVAVGIATVVAMVTVARGFRAQFNDFFAAGDAHLVLSRLGASDPFLSYLPDRLAGELEARPDVAEAHPFLYSAYQLPGQPFFFVYGTTRGSPLLEQLRFVEGGSIFDAGAPAAAICVGRAVARHLDLAAGDALELGATRYEIAGIFESTTPLLEAGGLLPFGEAQRVAGLQGEMSACLLRLEDFDPRTLPDAEAAIEAAFPEIEATPPATFSAAFDEFELAEQAVRVVSILAMLVGGLGVMNTMLMSVFERTREIGILQAVGWSKGMIIRQVMAEGVILCVLGGPVGMALGVAAVELVSAVGEMAWITGDYRIGVFGTAMAVALGMGIVGATYPAWRAVRVSPVEALRYE